MAREGYLIIDSDMHFTSRTISGRATWTSRIGEPPQFFAAEAASGKSAEDRERRLDQDMEVQGLTIPAFAGSQGAAASTRAEAAKPCASPAFQCCESAGFDSASTLTAMDIEGIDVAVMYGSAGGRSCATTISRPTMRRRWRARITTGPLTIARAIRNASICCADRDARYRDGGRRGAPMRERTGVRSQ